MLSVSNKFPSLRNFSNLECWIFAAINSVHLKMIKRVVNKVISLLLYLTRKSLSCRDCLPWSTNSSLYSERADLSDLLCWLLIPGFLLEAFKDDSDHQQNSPGQEISVCQPAARDKPSELSGKVRKGRILEHKGFEQPLPKPQPEAARENRAGRFSPGRS